MFSLGVIGRPGMTPPGSLLVIVLTVLSCAAIAQQDDSAARELFRLTNQARAQHGAAPLQWEERLAAIALAHAQEMAARDEMTHEFNGELSARERVTSTGLHTTVSGENVGFADRAPEIHDAWMNSPGHRSNILDLRFNVIGIAVVRRGRVLWAVQDFARLLPQTSESDVEQMVASSLSRQRAAGRMTALALVDIPDVRREACRMADQGSLNARAAARNLRNARAVFAVTLSDPSELPQGLAASPPSEARQFAVGACFRKDGRHPGGTNWVVVAFY